MAVFQTWPCFPLTLPYEVTVPGQSYAAFPLQNTANVSEYAAVVVPSRVIPCYYNMVIEQPTYSKLCTRKY